MSCVAQLRKVIICNSVPLLLFSAPLHFETSSEIVFFIWFSNARQLADFKLSNQLLAAKKSAQEAFLKSVLSKVGNCWSDFYKYIKRRKGNRENIPAIKDCNERIITDAIEKANTFNSYYSTVFSSEGNILHVRGENTGDPFTTDIKKNKEKN